MVVGGVSLAARASRTFWASAAMRSRRLAGAGSDRRQGRQSHALTVGWLGQSSEVSFPNREVYTGSAACSAVSQCLPGWKMTAGVLALGFIAALMPARRSSPNEARESPDEAWASSRVIMDFTSHSGRISCHAAAAIWACWRVMGWKFESVKIFPSAST